MLLRILLGILAILVIIQFIPVSHDNPPVTMDANVPGDAGTVLRTSCYDCHSNETRWPWYSYVAPISWMIRHDVSDGRKDVNFSEWDRYTPERRQKIARKAVHEVQEHQMPLDIYLLMHPDAEVDPFELQALQDWQQSGLIELDTARGVDSAFAEPGESDQDTTPGH